MYNLSSYISPDFEKISDETRFHIKVPGSHNIWIIIWYRTYLQTPTLLLFQFGYSISTMKSHQITKEIPSSCTELQTLGEGNYVSLLGQLFACHDRN